MPPRASSRPRISWHFPFLPRPLRPEPLRFSGREALLALPRGRGVSPLFCLQIFLNCPLPVRPFYFRAFAAGRFAPGRRAFRILRCCRGHCLRAFSLPFAGYCLAAFPPACPVRRGCFENRGFAFRLYCGLFDFARFDFVFGCPADFAYPVCPADSAVADCRFVAAGFGRSVDSAGSVDFAGFAGSVRSVGSAGCRLAKAF